MNKVRRNTRLRAMVSTPYTERSALVDNIEEIHQIDKPSPVNFDEFCPWMCLQCQFPDQIMVTKAIQEAYPKGSSRRQSNKSGISIRKNYYTEILESKTEMKFEEKIQSPDYLSTVPIVAYYDCRDNLVEIAIVNCPISINRVLIQVFSMCTPYHALLYKLTIRRGGLNSAVLHEIGNLLTNSNLTDICLDDSKVPLTNFDVLLEKHSKLKSLSLNRCLINDIVCKKLAANMKFGKPGSTLLTLELGSNLISDIGAQALGTMLRFNRHLMHLNLSGNMISDTGALAILNHLMEFSLTLSEIMKLKLRKFSLLRYQKACEESLNEEMIYKKKHSVPTSSCKYMTKSYRYTKSSEKKHSKAQPGTKLFALDSFIDSPDTDLDDIQKINEFPFNSDNITKRDSVYFYVGNMYLCSLNLGHNHLELKSVKKVHEVLKYQSGVMKTTEAKGLLRVVIEGNDVPEYCFDYAAIDMFLDKVICFNASLNVKKKGRTSTSQRYSSSRGSIVNKNNRSF